MNPRIFPLQEALAIIARNATLDPPRLKFMKLQHGAMESTYPNIAPLDLMLCNCYNAIGRALAMPTPIRIGDIKDLVKICKPARSQVWSYRWTFLDRVMDMKTTFDPHETKWLLRTGHVVSPWNLFHKVRNALKQATEILRVVQLCDDNHIHIGEGYSRSLGEPLRGQVDSCVANNERLEKEFCEMIRWDNGRPDVLDVPEDDSHERPWSERMMFPDDRSETEDGDSVGGMQATVEAGRNGVGEERTTVGESIGDGAVKKEVIVIDD